MEKHDMEKLNVGEDSVVIGNVSGNVGNRSVVVRATDSRGNTILNQPMAVGHNAHAGPGSIAIGAGAGAGSNLAVVLSEIGKIIAASDDRELIGSFNELCRELEKPHQDKSKISKLWSVIEKSAALNAAIGLVPTVTNHINALT